MTRDEEILNAARTRAERHQIAEMELYGGDKCNYSYGRIYFSEIASFEAGAKWADQHPNNVWHDASKFPNKALPIIVEIDDDIEPSYEVISIDETDEKFWEYLVSDRDITIWAYVKDLLPKGGEK